MLSASMSVRSTRLLMVLGKGGVGRSTVAASLAMALAREGQRVLVAEVAAQERLPALFRPEEAGPIGYTPTPVLPGVDALSIDPHHALQEYLTLQLPLGIGRLLFEHGAFASFAAAAPGLREMVTIGKLWYLLGERAPHGDRPRWDNLVVDAPATGHGLALLSTPRHFSEIARTGRINAQAGEIAATIADHERTAAVLVARPEELPVTEAGEAAEALRHRLGVRLAMVVANGVLEPRYGEPEAAAVAALEADPPAPLGGAAAAAVRAARREIDRSAAHGAEVARLERLTGARAAVLPLLDSARFGPREVATLSQRLEPACR